MAAQLIANSILYNEIKFGHIHKLFWGGYVSPLVCCEEKRMVESLAHIVDSALPLIKLSQKKGFASLTGEAHILVLTILHKIHRDCL